ncbi:MAG: PAS domain-containing protein [Cytophagales bacterium]
MNNKFTILNKILFPSLVIPFIAFAVLTIYSIYFSAKSMRDIRVSYASTMALNVMDKIDRNYYERFGDVQAFAYNPATLAALQNPSTIPVLTDFMNTMASYYVLYDLLLVVNENGEVVAFNTKDKTGNYINSEEILRNKNFAKEDWFLKAKGKPAGGAWYSGFEANEQVASIKNDNPKGYGVAFSAPIMDKEGNFKGVWYNFSSWKEITQKIRQEATSELVKSYPGAEIIITDRDNTVIDADEYSKNSILSVFEEKNRQEGHIIESFAGKGAYTFKGNNWKAIVIVNHTNSILDVISRHLVLILITIISLALSAFVIYYVTKSISNKLISIKNSIGLLSEGDLNFVNTTGEKEIEEMKLSINTLVEKLKEKSAFAEKIGNGELQTAYSASSDQDILGKSLLSMRANLFTNFEAEQKRNWVNTGLNQLAEILRESTEVNILCDKVLSSLIKYTNSLQGAIYLVDDLADNQQLTMVACYAFERKKYLNSSVLVGEGLIGQAYLESETTYLSEIPASLTISSGIGAASPNYMLIVPLSVNDETNGVLQLATFTKIEVHVIDFVEKIAQSLSLAIKNSKINERTNRLLQESQQQTEQMKSQEEEIRQNMEELAATQEEMVRKSEELEKLNNAESNSILQGINATMATIEFTPDGHILAANENFLKSFKYSIEEIKNKHHKMFVPSEIISSEDYKTFWNKLAAGEALNGVYKRMDSTGSTIWLNGIYTPILDAAGKVMKVMKFATNITDTQNQVAETRSMIEGMNKTMAIIEFSPTGIILKANEQWLKIVNYSLDDIVGKHHVIFAPKEIAESAEYKAFWANLAKGKTNSGLFKRKDANGKEIWLNAVYTPILDANGVVTKVSKFATLAVKN